MVTTSPIAMSASSRNLDSGKSSSLSSSTSAMSLLQMLGDLVVIRSFPTAAGSVLVSYVKARAESLNFNANVGLLTRVERYIITVFFLLLGQPVIAIWIIAIFANITALQRIWKVYQQA